MTRRSIERATRAVTARTIPITSRRCHSSMRSDSTAAGVFLSFPSPRLCCNGRVRAALWLLLVGSFAALSLYARATGARPDDDAVYQYETGIAGIAQALIVLTLLYWLSVGLPRREFFALRRPDSWPRSLGLAFGALLTIFVGAYAIVTAAGAGDEQNLTPEG